MATNINNFLQSHGSVLSQDINRRILPTSPWLQLPKKKAWPEEMSHTMRTMMWERTLPASITGWDVIDTPDGSGNPCNPSTDNVEFAQTIRTNQLAMKAIESPTFCVDDLRVKWKRNQQLNLVTESLADVARYYWIDRNRDNYVAACDTKVCLAAGLPASNEAAGDSFPTTEPTSILTNEVLDYYYMYLLREGARRKALRMNNGQPIFGAIMSAETSRYLTKTDGAVREDFRHGSKNGDLFKAMGYNQTYNGFFHMIDDTPRRFDFVTGAWVKREPWIDGGSGKWVQNPDYINAQYEDTVLWVEDVYESYVPMSVPSVGKSKFTPQNYAGDFKWLNIAHRTENPDGKNGFFRGILANSFRTMHAEFGIAIRHLRCPANLNFTGCSSQSVTSASY